MNRVKEGKPDGVEIPFGHEVIERFGAEPIILIKSGATVPQRLRAAAHVAATIADQLEAANPDAAVLSEAARVIMCCADEPSTVATRKEMAAAIHRAAGRQNG